MSRPMCVVCREVGPAAESFVRLSRGAKSREYRGVLCNSCWMSFVFLLEDQGFAWMDSLNSNSKGVRRPAGVKWAI